MSANSWLRKKIDPYVSTINVGILVATLTYIFVFILTRQNCWMEIELPDPMAEFGSKKLEIFSINWWKEGFNYPLFESAPRYYRPLSSYFQMLDFDFRNWLWRYIVPHQSLSLLWIFNFFLTPLMLFSFLRKLDVPKAVASLVVAMYVSNTGNLSVSAMYFRPGKALTNFSILAALLMASLLQDKLKPRRSTYWTGLVGFWIAAYILAFFDETAMLMVPAVLLIFPNVIFQNRKTAVLFCLWPLAIFLTYAFILPEITEWAGFPRPEPLTYDPLLNFLKPTQVAATNHPIGSFPYRFWHTARIAILDCLSLLNPWIFTNYFAMALQITTELAVGAFAFVAFRKSRGHIKMTSLKSRLVILFTLFCLFDVYALATTANGVWGLYYYGIYLVPIAAIFIAVNFKSWESEWRLPKAWLSLGGGLIIASSLYIFPYTNFAYKHVFFPVTENHPQRLRAIFLNETNRFTEREKYEIPNLSGILTDYWSCFRIHFGCKPPDLLELDYLRKEIHY